MAYFVRNIIHCKGVALSAPRHTAGLIALLAGAGARHTSTVTTKSMPNVVVLRTDHLVDDGLRFIDENFRIEITLERVSFSIGEDNLIVVLD